MCLCLWEFVWMFSSIWFNLAGLNLHWHYFVFLLLGFSVFLSWTKKYKCLIILWVELDWKSNIITANICRTAVRAQVPKCELSVAVNAQQQHVFMLCFLCSLSSIKTVQSSDPTDPPVAEDDQRTVPISDLMNEARDSPLWTSPTCVYLPQTWKPFSAPYATAFGQTHLTPIKRFYIFNRFLML